jgi:hypothetical protein
MLLVAQASRLCFAVGCAPRTKNGGQCPPYILIYWLPKGGISSVLQQGWGSLKMRADLFMSLFTLFPFSPFPPFS